MLRDGQHVELGFDDKTQRALRAAQQAVEVEAPIGFAQVGEVIAGEAAVERREDFFDQLLLVIGNVLGAAIHLADHVVALGLAVRQFVCQRLAVEAFAAQQHGRQFEHVVAGFAVGATALAAGVGVDHAADGGPVRGGQLGGKKQAVGFQCCVELVFDHAALHAHPALFDVDFEDVIEVAGQIDHQPVGQRLAVGARAAATRGQHDRAVFRPRGECAQAFDIGVILGEHRSLRQTLINGVVGGQHGSEAEITGDFTLEAFRCQCA